MRASRTLPLSTLMSVVESAIEEGLILHAEYLGLTVTTAGEQSGAPGRAIGTTSAPS